MNEKFRNLLDKAVQFHGHLCGGQVIGVRMAMTGLRELGIVDPRSEEGRDLVIFIEIDRCAADAIISVTGRTPGRRSIKLLDYGKMAATFVDTKSNRAVRVSVDGKSDKKVDELARSVFADKTEKQANIAALMEISENELFKIQEVFVALKPEDLPGKPLASTICEGCGEIVKDRREVESEGKTLCRPCADGKKYYTLTDEFSKVYLKTETGGMEGKGDEPTFY